MFIIWGARQSRKNLGRVASFCEDCRAIVAMQLTVVREYNHLYFIPVSRFKIIAHETTCKQCRRKSAVDIDDFRAVCTDRSSAMQELIAQTNPNLPQWLAQWQALQQRAVAGEITDAERAGLIVERIARHLDKIAARAGQTNVDGMGCLAGLLSLVCTCFLGYVWIMNSNAGWAAPIMITAIVVAWSPTIYLVGTDPRRFVARKIRPILAKELAPLNPIPDEIAAAIDVLKERLPKLDRYMPLESLIDAITKQMLKDDRKADIFAP